MRQRVLPPTLAELSDARRIIIARIARRSRVLLLDDDEAFRRAIADAKASLVSRSAGEAPFDVVVELGAADEPLPARLSRIREQAPTAPTAIVVAARPARGVALPGYALCEAIPVARPPLARWLGSGRAAGVVAACRDWPSERTPPLRWLKYRISRVIGTAVRFEALGTALAREHGLGAPEPAVLLLRATR